MLPALREQIGLDKLGAVKRHEIAYGYQLALRELIRQHGLALEIHRRAVYCEHILQKPVVQLIEVSAPVKAPYLLRGKLPHVPVRRGRRSRRHDAAQKLRRGRQTQLRQVFPLQPDAPHDERADQRRTQQQHENRPHSERRIAALALRLVRSFGLGWRRGGNRRRARGDYLNGHQQLHDKLRSAAFQPYPIKLQHVPVLKSLRQLQPQWLLAPRQADAPPRAVTRLVRRQSQQAAHRAPARCGRAPAVRAGGEIMFSFKAAAWTNHAPPLFP